MSGFQFSLKGRVTKPGKLKARPVKNVLGDEKEEKLRTSIDGFQLKVGALAGSEAVGKKVPLVIKPVKLATGLTKQLQKSQDGLLDAKARESLLSGEQQEYGGTVIAIPDDGPVLDNTEEDYENVPVEEFGAALLRGMGWDGETKATETQSLAHRQRGVVLGIGAKGVEKEIEQELMGKKLKLNVPMVQREKQ